MPHIVFISYAHQDEKVASEVCNFLEQQGIACWIAPRDILAGDDYAEALMSAIYDAKAMVLILSTQSNESPHVRKEVERAVNRKLVIAPLRIEELVLSRGMEYYLCNAQWVDASTEGHQTVLPKFTESLKKKLNFTVVETPSQSMPKKSAVLSKNKKIEAKKKNETKIVFEKKQSTPVKKMAVSPSNQKQERTASYGNSVLHNSSSEELNLKILEVQSLKFVQIPAGSFLMGTGEKYHPDELVHHVSIKSFQIMAKPVTQALWKLIVGGKRNWFWNEGDDLPAHSVSWLEVKKFIEKINKLDPGKGYRLPSEAEWEYACRAGSTSLFCIGDKENDLARVGWYGGNSGSKIHPVGKKEPNAWGLFDMLGNVYEWCEDMFHDSYYGAPIDGSAWTSPQATSEIYANYLKHHIVRGGVDFRTDFNYFNPARSNSAGSDKIEDYIYVGFRLARDRG